MSGESFSRKVISPLEKVVSKDINQLQGQHARGYLEAQRQLFAKSAAVATDGGRGASVPVSGCLGQGLRVRPQASPDRTVTVKAGMAFQETSGTLADGFAASISDYDSYTGLDDLCLYKPIVLPSDMTLSVPDQAGSGDPEFATMRWDLIEVRCNRRIGDALSVYVLDPVTGVYSSGGPSLYKGLLFNIVAGYSGTVTDPAASTAALSYKVGIPDGTTPVKPSVTAGYMPLAYVFVSSAIATVDYDNVIDARTLLLPNGTATGALSFIMSASGSTAPEIYYASVPAGVEAYVVQHADTIGWVWVYLLTTCSFMSASGSAGKWFPDDPSGHYDHAVTELFKLDMSPPQLISLLEVSTGDEPSDTDALASSLNAIGVVKTCPTATAFRFLVHVEQADEVVITDDVYVTLTLAFGA